MVFKEFLVLGGSIDDRFLGSNRSICLFLVFSSQTLAGVHGFHEYNNVFLSLFF